MKNNARLTQSRLRELLSYDPETGIFTWRVSRGKAIAGGAAGVLDTNGYIRITVDGVLHSAHRLAWLHVTGNWPDTQIDHRNLDRSDNRIDNLRHAQPSQNCHNQGIRITNRSSVKGVYFHRASGKWEARCAVRGRNHYLGRYTDIELAEFIVQEFRLTHYGEFARL